MNLLGNAVKFTPEGGKIGLDVSRDAFHDGVSITVWDTGIGISPEDLPRFFQQFVQLDSRLSRQYAGTGLGLVLVRRMVEMHGGKVTVESDRRKREPLHGLPAAEGRRGDGGSSYAGTISPLTRSFSCSKQDERITRQ